MCGWVDCCIEAAATETLMSVMFLFVLHTYMYHTCRQHTDLR